MEAATANDDFAQDVILLSHRYDPGGLAKDVLDNLSPGLNPLTVLDHQQGNVLVDLMCLLRDPKQGATLIHLKAILG